MNLDNLFFVPLDISPPPQVDQTLLMEYCKEWKQHCAFPKQIGYYDKTNDYPWNDPVQPFKPDLIDPSVIINPKLIADLPFFNFNVNEIELEFREKFRKLFPELTEYVETQFPFKFNLMTFLFQNTSKEVIGHTDADDEWAFRFYLWNNFQDNALWFRPSRNPSKKIVPNLLIDDYSEFKDPVYVKFPRKEYIPWAFNSYKTIHGVHAASQANLSRCAVIVRGVVDPDKLKDLLIRSVNKYPEYAAFI
jgi:hypothetical protein